MATATAPSFEVEKTDAYPARRFASLIATTWFCALTLTLWCGFLFFYGLNAGELWRTEGLRAIIAQEMLRSGNWIVPTLYGEPLFTKPPGMYAAIALVSWPVGGVTEWTARLPSALAATATVLLFFWFFSSEFGRPWGLAAALILPMSPMWLDKAPSAEIEALHVFWVTASILFLLCALSPKCSPRSSDGWWLAALLCVAGGVLTKWTAPVFFYLTAIPLLWRRGQFALLFGRGHLVGAAVAATLCLAWMAAAIRLSGWDIFWNTLMREALYRLVPNYAEEPYRWHEVVLHPVVIFLTTLPWSVMALWSLRPGFARSFDDNGQRLLQGLQCWLWPNLLFFSLATEHTPRHSFPFFPAIAGLAVMTCISISRKTAMVRSANESTPLSPRGTGDGGEGATAVAPSENTEQIGRPRNRRVWPARLIVAWALLWIMLKVGFIELAVPQRNGTRDPRAKGELLASLVPSDMVLYLLKLKDEGIMFYYDRPIQRLDSALELPKNFRNVYCILTDSEFASWTFMFELSVIQRLHDQQGDAIVLVRVDGRKRGGL